MKTFSNIIFVVILLFSSAVFASAETDFDMGVKSFKAGNHATAVDYFESAIKQGMKSVALQFYLASSYYRLERYDDARELFQVVNQTVAMRDLAEYNLGLVAIKQKQWDLARQYFNLVITSGKDKKLTKLSKKHLAAMQKKEKKLSAYLALNIGYDDNISSVTDDSVLNTSDTFYDYFALANLQISGNKKDGWMTNVSLYQIDFTDTSGNDQFRYSLGLKKTFKLSDWETSVNLGLSKTTIDDEDYQSVTKLDLKGRKPVSKSDRFYLRYQGEEITSDKPIFDYQEGFRHRTRIEYRNYSTQNIKQIYYELELNDRGTLVTPSYSYDYSPTRHTVRGIYTHIFNKTWHVKGDLSYRSSDFPKSPDIEREEQQWKLALSIDYQFDKTFRLTTIMQFTDNSSSEDIYEYDKSVFRIGLSKSF